MTTLAVTRDETPPTKAKTAEVPPDASDADKPPSLTNILAKSVPVGLVSAYTAFIAIVTEVVEEPTKQVPNPEQYLAIRWIAFVILVLAAALLTQLSYKRTPGGKRPVCWPELGAVTVAAASWGLAIPESPLLAALTDKAAGLLTLGLIAFAGVAINLVLGALIQKKA